MKNLSKVRILLAYVIYIALAIGLVTASNYFNSYPNDSLSVHRLHHSESRQPAELQENKSHKLLSIEAEKPANGDTGSLKTLIRANAAQKSNAARLKTRLSSTYFDILDDGFRFSFSGLAPPIFS